MSFEELKPEDEFLSREDERVHQLLGSLNKVDAPKDFNFQLKARIARAKSDSVEDTRLFPILRYIAPLGLAVVILAVFVFNGVYSFDNQSVPVVVSENFSPKTSEKANLSVNKPQEIVVVAQSNTQKTTIENLEKKETPKLLKETELAVNPPKRKFEPRNVEYNGGGSKVSTSSTGKIISLQNINTDKKPQPVVNSTPPSVKDVLSLFGIESAYSDNKWKVTSVKQDSLTGRAGVKPNDIIEAIDEKQISNETVLTGAFSGKSLNVVRDGKLIVIKLQNK